MASGDSKHLIELQELPDSTAAGDVENEEAEVRVHLLSDQVNAAFSD